MLGNAIVLIEQMIKGPTLTTVIALRTLVCVTAQLTAQNQNRSAIGFHGLQGIE